MRPLQPTTCEFSSKVLTVLQVDVCAHRVVSHYWYRYRHYHTQAIKTDASFISAMAKRGVNNMDLVCVDPWSAGGYILAVIVLALVGTYGGIHCNNAVLTLMCGSGWQGRVASTVVLIVRAVLTAW